MLKPTLLLVVLLLLLQGCVVDSDISPRTTERVLSAVAQDFNLDNQTDFKAYLFRPVTVTSESGVNITFQKSVTAGEAETTIDIKSVNVLSDDDIASLETLMFQFDSDRKDKEIECKETLGLTGAGIRCGSPKDCASICTGSLCKKYDYASELIGYWIYRFSQDEDAMDHDISELRDQLVALKDASITQREMTMRKLNAVLDRTIAINTNPLLNENMFGICRAITYDNSKLKEMLDILGKYERTPNKYIYAINLKTTVKSRDYVELNVFDTLPKPMLSGLSSIQVPQEGGVYDAKANNISWRSIKASIYTDSIVGYTLQSNQNIREDIFENWPTPKVSMRVVSFTKNPVVSGIIEVSKQIYAATKGLGYYTALALIAGFWDIVIFFTILLLKIIIAGISTVISRTGLRDNLIAAYGKANIYWKEYAVFAVLFIAIGYGFMLFAAKVSEDILNVDNIVRHLAESIQGTLSMIFFFLGVHLIYSLAEDRLKGALAGRAYYENILDISPKANELRLKKLKEKLKELEQALGKAGKIDVGEERNILISAPLDRIEALIKTPGNEKAAKELIEVYTYKVESAIMHLEEKIRIFEEYWNEWNKEIRDKLAEQDNVPFSALSGIPSGWRSRAVNRYVVENPDEDLIVDGEGVRRLEASPEKKGYEILKKMISKNEALGGVIFKKDGITSVHSSVGNKTLEGILSWKVSNYAKTLGQKVLNSNYLTIQITGEKNTIAFIQVEDKEGVVFAKKDKINDALADFQAKLKRL